MPDRFIRRALVTGLVTVSLAGCASAPKLTAPLTVPRSVPFAASAGVTDEVRNECLLESNLAEHLRSALSDKYQTVSQADRITSTTPGRTLTAKITQILAPGGGAYSGPKNFTVEGVLRDNGRVIGSFTARRERVSVPRPGTVAVGPSASTCGILLQLSKTMSKDIAQWAREPTMNAQLGFKLF